MVYTYITLIKVKKNKEIHTFFTLVTINILIFHALQNRSLSFSFLHYVQTLKTPIYKTIPPPPQHQKLDLQLTR